MKWCPLVLSCLVLLPACVVTRRPVSHVPPKEAAWYKVPYELPVEGRESLSGRMVAAAHLAMDHFLPWDRRPSLGADPVSVCLLQRQSWDVETAPGPGGTILVQFSLSPGACSRHGSIADLGATYAVDVDHRRILAIRHP
jgi:hypothetical protein